MFDEMNIEATAISSMMNNNGNFGKGEDSNGGSAGKDPSPVMRTACLPQASPNDVPVSDDHLAVLDPFSPSASTGECDGKDQIMAVGGDERSHSPSQSSADPAFSMNFHDYRLGEAIGYGSSAVVHLATYIPSGTAVAIKIIELDRFEPGQIDTLRREIQVMSLCRHGHLLPVLASFVHGSQLWIVTPFMAGGSCLDLLRVPDHRGGIVNESAIATILFQALQGLAYLHANGHMHRDVKAGNLLLGLDGTVQLADFGVSASLLEGAGPGGQRKTFVGTPCWMAPEVMEMTKGYDSKADIWSFGITAFELATGHAPYAKLPAMKVIFVTLSNEAPKFNRHRTRVTYSKALKEMIGMCLQKDPEKRPTAESLLKHPFFRQAKRKEYLVAEILAATLPITERARKQKTSAVGGGGKSVRIAEPPIPEEEWDFSDSASTGSNGSGLSTSSGEEDEFECPVVDRRGRFVVEALHPSTAQPSNNSNVFSPTATITGPAAITSAGLEETAQSTVLSGECAAAVAAEIRKGRFSVNAAVGSTTNTNGNGGNSTANGCGTNGSGSPEQNTATAVPVQQPLSPTAVLLEGALGEEEGRKSRFEVVHPTHDTSMQQNQQQQQQQRQSVAAAQEVRPRMASAPLPVPHPVQQQLNQEIRPDLHHHQQQQQLYQQHQAVQSHYYQQHQMLAVIDALVQQTEMMRGHLMDLRSRLAFPPSYHPAATAATTMLHQPIAPDYHMGHIPMTSAAMAMPYSSQPLSPQLSPLASGRASQSDIADVERQMAQLRLENEQLRRRLQ